MLGHIAILRPNLPKFLISVKIRNFQVSYLRLTNLTCSECQILEHWGYISFLGQTFLEMRGLILVLTLSVCYLAVILIFFLEATARYLVVTGGYCSLPLVTARSHFQYERIF